MNVKLKNFIVLILLLAITFGCNQESGDVMQPPVSTKKEFLTFAFLASHNPALPQDVIGVIDPATNQVSLILPAGTDKTSLIADFTYTGKMITIGETPQESGVTANDFSTTVLYHMTAEDWSERDVAVKADFQNGNSQVTFTQFDLKQSLHPGLKATTTGAIDNQSKSIYLDVGFGMDRGSVRPTFVLSSPATVSVTGASQTSEQTAVDFYLSPLTYHIVDANGEYVDYTVSLNMSPPVFSGLWDIIDGSTESGLNYNPIINASTPDVIGHGTQVFFTWNETGQIRLAAMNQSGIIWADGGATTGLNFNTAQNATAPNMAEFNSELYLTWVEFDGAANQIRVAKWDGVSSKIMVDGGLSTGLNKNVTLSAATPKLFSAGGTLYLTWSEVNAGLVPQVRVKKFNGTSWTWAEAAGTNGVNYDGLKPATNPQLMAFQGLLYLIWEENNAFAPNIRVAKWDGGLSWSFIDGAGLDGLNGNFANAAGSGQLFVLKNELYATWHENSPSVSQIRVKRWVPPTWNFEDSGSFNHNSLFSALNPKVVIFDNKALFTWAESDGVKNQIRVRHWDGGTKVDFVDGNASTGLNYNVTKGVSNPAITVQGDGVFLTWQEFNASSFEQIRLAMPQFQ